MSLFTVAFQTFGCKLNQLETESIAEAFRTQAFRVVPSGDPADLYIVNTCTVTSKAEQKARRLIRKSLRENPNACLVATGCYAQLDGSDLASLVDDRRIIVVSLDRKASLLDLPAFLADSACGSADLPEVLARWAQGEEGDRDRFRFDVHDFSFHSRASLKIQDGCDNRCAFCRVRLARGPSVSLDAPSVLARLRELERHGYAEAVLTGVNLNQYRDGDRDFTALLAFLLDGTERIALRISSTEPEGVDAEFARVVAHPRIRPHFHLSVQSGSDAVLARMRRRYNAERVERAAALLRSAKDDPFLAGDIIAGFPGESEADFERTYDLCRRIGLAWIHAFPYSPRPGTEAAALDHKVSERDAALRVDRLIDLARQGRQAYLRRWVGRDLQAVVESDSRRRSGHRVAAVSENYLKISLLPPPAGLILHPGTAIRCRIVDVAAGPEATEVPTADREFDGHDVIAEYLEII